VFKEVSPIKVIWVVSVLLTSTLVHAQTGQWSGSLNVQGVSLDLVFNLSQDGEATLDVPDQGAKGIKAEIQRNGLGGVTISIPSIGARFEGFWDFKAINGTFTQMGTSLPLSLKPGVPRLNRPQTPVGPFPYTEEQIEFANGSACLKATLTHPENEDSDTAVVIFITGSGLQNRDEELYEHKPFAVIADALARVGVASLRYDDRGAGESTGDVVNVTTDDFKNDALAGIKLLRERYGKVGVIGHSEGGTFALLLAAEGQVDFAISLAGMGVSGKETLLRQNRNALAKAGIGQDETDRYVQLLSDSFDNTISGTKLPDAGQYNLSEPLKANYTQVARQLATPYLKSFLALDARTSMDRIKCPVLALNGTKDTQVDYNTDLKAIREGIKKKYLTVAEMEGLNHLFQHCRTGETDEYKTIEETISPDVLSMIIKWITLHK